MLTEGLAAYRATGALVGVPNILRFLAECRRRAGQPREGLTYLDEAACYIEAMHIRSSEAEIYRLRGELLIAVGDPVSAEASFRRAIAVAHSQSAKLWELRAAMSLAQFLRDRGKRASSRRSTAGSPKVSTRRSCNVPRRCSMNCGDLSQAPAS
jgi:tetratricopeptide (TPR) repeat protein